jgi:hypothetical protein
MQEIYYGRRYRENLARAELVSELVPASFPHVEVEGPG